MTDNLPEPFHPPGWLKWVLSGEIPGAVEAIAKLVGTTASSASAWIAIPGVKGEQIQQRIRDDTNARTIISKALAEAAAQHGIKDVGHLERAFDRWSGEAIRYQTNRESIAYKTAEHLSEGEPPHAETPPPDDDWMNFYSSHAEKATSEKLQDTWARVLAGEIRKPGTFSLRTIQFISTLDSEIAQDFGDIADRIFEGRLLFDVFVANSGESFDRVRRLNDVGLLGNAISWTNTYDNKVSFIQNNFYTLYLQTEWGTDYKFNAYPLTKVGREIYSIMAVKDEFRIAREFSKAITRFSRAQRIDIFKRKESLEVTLQGQSLGHTELIVDRSTGNFVEVTYTEHA